MTRSRFAQRTVAATIAATMVLAVAQTRCIVAGDPPAPQVMPARSAPSDSLRDPREVRLRNVRQITFGGENAEAYWSFDGKWVSFQSTRGDYPCDQQYVMRADGSQLRRVSTGTGRTTCGYFYKNGTRVLFASTHLASAECPPKPDYSKGYVWALYPSFDIFTARTDASDLQRLTHEDGYDAEAVVSPDGKRVVFTSMRTGDPEIYVMNIDGTNVRQLTHTKGYDGGPWWSKDGKWIVYRAFHPETPEQVADYDALIAENLIRPSVLEIYTMNADGSNNTQVTHLNAATFCPFPMPDGKRILFASNVNDPKKRNFDVYLVNRDGTGLEQVTYDAQFDAFPMLSRDGKRLMWCANRHNGGGHDTNVFIADWVNDPRK